MKQNSGFTLIELMVVIMMVGILANIAVGRIGDYTTKARCTEAVVTLSTYERLQSVYLGINGNVGSLLDIGLEPPRSDYFTYTAEIEVTQGEVLGGVQTAAKGGNSGGGSGGSGGSGGTGSGGGNDGGNGGGNKDGGIDGDGNSGGGNNPGGCDPDNPAHGSSCPGGDTQEYSASILATSQKYLTLYCRNGDGVYSEMSSNGRLTRGNTTGGNCGKYMGSWFK